MFHEYKITPLNMTSCVRHNVRKHREIKKCDKYTVLVIYSKMYCLENRELTSSESRDYMGIPGKGLPTSLDLRNKTPKNKQKASFAITDITNQYFRKLLKRFEDSPDIGYNSKQVHK